MNERFTALGDLSVLVCLARQRRDSSLPPEKIRSQLTETGDSSWGVWNDKCKFKKCVCLKCILIICGGQTWVVGEATETKTKGPGFVKWALMWNANQPITIAKESFVLFLWRICVSIITHLLVWSCFQIVRPCPAFIQITVQTNKQIVIQSAKRNGYLGLSIRVKFSHESLCQEKSFSGTIPSRKSSWTSQRTREEPFR